MKVDKIIFFDIGPFIPFDWVIEVIVISFSALFAVSAGDIMLAGHDTGDLWPFRDLELFVELLQHSVLLTYGKSTSWVQALRSPILLYMSITPSNTAERTQRSEKKDKYHWEGQKDLNFWRPILGSMSMMKVLP